MKTVRFIALLGLLLGFVACSFGAEPDVKTKVKIGFALSGSPKKVKAPAKACTCFEGGECECGENCRCAVPKNENTALYRSLRAAAIRNSQPLLIWVNSPESRKALQQFRDCSSYECQSFQGSSDPRTIVGIPDGRGDIDAATVIDGEPCVQCVRGFLDAPKEAVQVRVTTPNYQCQGGNCPTGNCPTCQGGNCASCNTGACPSCSGGVQGVPCMGCQSGCCGGSCGSGGCVGCQGSCGSFRRHR